MSTPPDPQSPPQENEPALSAEVLDAEPARQAPPREPGEKKNFHHQAARASWIAPLVAAILGMLASAVRQQSRTGALVIGIANLLIILLGLIFAIVALAGVRGRRGIVVPAGIGLLINLALLGTFIGFLLTGRRDATFLGAGTPPANTVVTLPPTPALPPPPPTARSDSKDVANAMSGDSALPALPAVPPPAGQIDPRQQRARDAVEKFPGWIGIGNRSGGLVLLVLQTNDQAPGTREFKETFASPCTVMWISANNSAGDRPHVIDPASLEMHFADYRKIAALPPAAIVATAKVKDDPVLARSLKPASVPAHSNLPDCAAFLPADTDLTQANAATIVLDGQRVVIPGRYLTVEEKARLLTANKR